MGNIQSFTGHGNIFPVPLFLGQGQDNASILHLKQRDDICVSFRMCASGKILNGNRIQKKAKKKTLIRASLHAGRGDRTPTPLTGTRPSTWRVYQFRHPRRCHANRATRLLVAPDPVTVKYFFCGGALLPHTPCNAQHCLWVEGEMIRFWLKFSSFGMISRLR